MVSRGVVNSPELLANCHQRAMRSAPGSGGGAAGAGRSISRNPYPTGQRRTRRGNPWRKAIRVASVHAWRRPAASAVGESPGSGWPRARDRIGVALARPPIRSTGSRSGPAGDRGRAGGMAPGRASAFIPGTTAGRFGCRGRGATFGVGPDRAKVRGLGNESEPGRPGVAPKGPAGGYALETVMRPHLQKAHARIHDLPRAQPVKLRTARASPLYGEARHQPSVGQRPDDI